ncbi:MAG TPA: lysylphosphatidylglycerol synthase domain-containing protein, partial [Acidimicrobiia bacterium]|nr:lysylphosphatidylglycerol synthase domain-containing protein [Acidimicrobiia bacterium]
LGVVISQSAFQAGSLQASLPVLTITEPLVAAAIGLAAFHEHVATHGVRLVGLSVAVLVLAAGVIGLARSPLVVGGGPPVPAPVGPVPPVLPAGESADGPDADRPVARPVPGGRRRLVPVVRVGIGLALGALAISVLSGRRNEIEGATALLEHARWGWLLLAGPVELASLLAYAALERRLLRAGRRPIPIGGLLQITLAGNAIQNSLPGGAAWAAGFAFGQFRRRGADAVLAGWTLLAAGFVSNVTLVVVAIAGVAVAKGQASANDLVGAILVVGAVAVALAVGYRLGIHTRWAPRILALGVWIGEQVMRRRAEDPGTVAQEALERLSAVRPSPMDWAAAGGWGAANWLLDCACLAFTFPLVGAAVPWRGLLLAYGAGQLAANLPFTPGGLGAVEGSLTVALVAYGSGEVQAVAAVLVYRIITFWLLLVVGWTIWAHLKWRTP